MTGGTPYGGAAAAVAVCKAAPDPSSSGTEKPAMAKVNCWQFKQCGRQQGGARSAESGVCPASAETRVHGTNGGTNGGRACWALAGTLCGGRAQGTFASKLNSCMKCEFYQLVGSEEGPNHESARDILAKLK